MVRVIPSYEVEPDIAFGVKQGTASQGTAGRLSYGREFWEGRRALAAAFLGLAAGYTINNYLNNLFIPELMHAFGWKATSVALVGAAAMLSMIVQPLAGSLADRFGVRPVALPGIILGAGIFLLLSLMTGAFWQFAALATAQIVLVASTTGPVVFSRPICEEYRRARGLALASAICAPSLAGALLVPPFTAFLTAYGWRSGYRLVAITTLIVGVFAVLLVRPRPSAPKSAGLRPDAHPDASVEGEIGIAALLRLPTIRLIMAGMALCSLSVTLQTTQLKVVLLGLGLKSMAASDLITAYASGVIAGRILSGIALDALPTRLVAAVGMSLPGMGLLLLATGTASPLLLYVAVLTLGLSLGAEGDIAGYLVMTYLPKHVYSKALGLLVGALSFSAGIGGVLLSILLAATGSFEPFLTLAGIAAIAGGALFLKLRRLA